ncbi:hypothetical protein Tco_1546425 [Tanacetum coccineum]
MMSLNGFDDIEIALQPCRMHPPSSIIILSENIVLLLCCWNLMGESGLHLGEASRPESCLQPWQVDTGNDDIICVMSGKLDKLAAMAGISSISRLVRLSEPHTHFVVLLSYTFLPFVWKM